ncbi:MAG: hypothetical protein LBS04_00735 [Tannerellaceae bacterium]|jgi:hypothetical protein|nr:hypothetical protein [Tannerellaceae bacterium]
MAIFQSDAFFDAHGSVGNLTFRNVNGRIIVSRKITRNNSNTPRQKARRSSFALMARLGKSLRPVIQIGFDPVRNGNKYNHFNKANAALADFLSLHDVGDYASVPLYMLYKVLGDDSFTGHVMAARGSMEARSEFVINAGGQVSGLLSLSRAFQAGDRITVVVALLTDVQRRLMETVALHTYSLTPLDLKGMASPNQLVITPEGREELNLCALSPPGGKIRGVITTAIVCTPPGGARPDRSTAFFGIPAGGGKK